MQDTTKSKAGERTQDEVNVIWYHCGDDIRTRDYPTSMVQEWNGAESVKIAGQWFLLNPALPQLIEDREIPHRSESRGPRIRRVQRIAFQRTVTEVSFWYDDNGKLLKVA